MRCYDLIQEALSLLNDPNQQFFKQADMLRHANRTLKEVMNRAMTLREIQYSGVAEGQGAFGLPHELLRIQGCAWKKGSQWDPLAQTSLTISQYLTHASGFRTERPYYYDLWGRGRVEKYAGGVAHATDTHVTLDDPINGILVGDVMLSVTDGSEAVITRVDAGTGSVTMAVDPFVGGTRATLLDAGGHVNEVEVRIVSPMVFPHVLYISPPPNFTSKVGEEPLWIYMIRTHYTVTQEAIDNANDMLEIDLELEVPVLYRLLYWATMQDSGAEDMRTMKYQTDYETEYHKQQPYIRRRIHEFESTWGMPGARGGGRGDVLLSGVSSHSEHVFNRNTIA